MNTTQNNKLQVINQKMKTTKEKIVYKGDASGIKGNVLAVYLPESISEIQRIINLNQNIVPRGGGTGLAGGCVPLNSVVVDVSKLNKIISIDLKYKIAEVEAGITLEELNQELAKYNLEFPVNPSSAKSCTVGGMIATNAVGTRAVKYGRTSDWLKELELVDGRGNLVKTHKLDFPEVVGMEGTTGIITKAKLRLTEKKERTASLTKISELEKIPEIVRKLKARIDVSMLEIFDKLTSRYMGLPEIYHILIEFESEQGEFKGKDYEKIIELRNSAYPKLASEGFSHIEDPKILPFKFPQLAKFLESKGIPFFGHIGEGIIHPCFKQEQIPIVDEMMNFVRKLNGMITGEHGIGISKKKYLEENDKKIFMRIKKRYDPEFKINPGKIIDKPEQVTSTNKNIEEEKKEGAKINVNANAEKNAEQTKNKQINDESKTQT